MSSIIGIPTTRVSDSFIRQRMLTQVQSDQAEMFRIQTQLSTGHRFEAPSEDPIAAQRVMGLQSLLARKAQVKSNLTTNQSYLTATDSAMGNIASLLSEARATALGVLGTTATDTQRQAAAQQIDQTIRQMIDMGNQQFRGRYIFAGSSTQIKPFSSTDAGYVQYSGNEARVPSFADIDQLFDTNLNGSEAFGAISQAATGGDLKPVLNYDTRLADLRHGAGITPGSIEISDGHSTSTIDINSAATIGDVAALVRDHPPAGRTLEVEVSATGLVIKLTPDPGGGFDPAADNLSVREVGGGTTASDLGIRREDGVGGGPLMGDALDPVLRATTSLTDILGTRATAYLHADGKDNDIIVQAKTRGDHTADGTSLNGVNVQLVADAPAAGQETADFTAGTLTVHIKLGETRAYQVVNAINNAAAIPFTARLDPLDNVLGGLGTIDKLTTAQTAGGSGTEFDQSSGLQITNGGKATTVSLASAKTVEDAINLLNGAGLGLLAEINAAKTGLNIRSRTSGADFMIGENGGSTATQFGVRSLGDNTLLTSLNFGRGVNDYLGDPPNGVPGTDFTITTSDGTQIAIDVHGARTIGQVRDIINQAGGGKVRAELAEYGNGLTLFDDSAASGPIAVTRGSMSTAAIDLGLVATGQDSSTSTAHKTSAAAGVTWNEPNNDLLFQAKSPGTYGNVQIVIQNNPALLKGEETAHYDPAAKTLTFDIAAGASDAKDIIAALKNDPAADAAFSASLDTSRDPANNGAGAVHVTTAAMTGGQAEMLAGTDVNPLETDSAFNALLRLRDALQNNDNTEAQRSIGLLDQSVTDMSFSRAELSARQQGVQVMQDRLDAENIDLQSVMSTEYDADLAQVVSDLSARQIAYQASLQAAGNIFKYSLLDYI